MITAQISADELYSTEIMPNFVVWNWMRTGLNLSGSNLMIFAYIYSQSFDDDHMCNTSLSQMERWFGITRQTLSRNIDKLPYVKKFISQSHEGGGFYTFNYYRVDMPMLIERCSCTDEETYEDFMLSYKQILELKFPNDKKSIDDYFSNIIDWHKNISKDNLSKINAITKLGDDVRNNPEDYIKKVFSVAISETLSAMNLQNVLKDISHSNLFAENSDSVVNNSDIHNGLEISDKHVSLNVNNDNNLSDSVNSDASNISHRRGARPVSQLGITVTKPKTKKTKAERNAENLKDCQDYVRSFVALDCENNQELLDTLLAYLDVRIASGLTKSQWMIMLKKFKRSCSSIDEMIYNAEVAVSRGYRDLDYKGYGEASQKNNLVNDKKSMYKNIDNFVMDKCENNEELKELLKLYVDDVAVKNKLTPAQFSQLLITLNNICVTVPEKIASVRQSYGGGWKSFSAINTGYGNRGSSATSALGEVEMSEKEKEIDDFIARCYLYQYPKIKELLLKYIHSTSYGKSVTADMFRISLNSLRLHIVGIPEMEQSISEAILNNSDKLFRENYEDNRQAIKAHGSLESRVAYIERNRRYECEKARHDNPNDPMYAGMAPDLTPGLFDDDANKIIPHSAEEMMEFRKRKFGKV